MGYHEFLKGSDFDFYLCAALTLCNIQDIFTQWMLFHWIKCWLKIFSETFYFHCDSYVVKINIHFPYTNILLRSPWQGSVENVNIGTWRWIDLFHKGKHKVLCNSLLLISLSKDFDKDLQWITEQTWMQITSIESFIVFHSF